MSPPSPPSPSRSTSKKTPHFRPIVATALAAIGLALGPASARAATYTRTYLFSGGQGGALGIAGFAVSNGVVSITVQLERKAPLGHINGSLCLYGADDLAAGFGDSPIADESIGFGTGDPRFHIAPTTDLVTQTVTATFSVNAVAETFFKAVIE